MGYQEPNPSDSKATLALVMGILALVLNGLIVFGILGLVFASQARKMGNTSGKVTAGFVMSIIGLVFGILAWFVCVPALCTIGMLV